MIITYKGKKPNIHKTAYINETATVLGDVVLGANSSVWFNAIIRGDMNYVRIGENTSIQDNSVVHVTTNLYPVEIGDRVTIGHSAIVHGCKIGSDCLISMGVIILDNAVIGDHCIIGAGSVVTEGCIIPPETLAVGIPAKPKKKLKEADFDNIRKYWMDYIELKNNYMREFGSDEH